MDPKEWAAVIMAWLKSGLNQFRKWVVIDAQSNLHYEKAGIPLSAWEIRAEWLRDAGKSVDHMVGVPPQLRKEEPRDELAALY